MTEATGADSPQLRLTDLAGVIECGEELLCRRLEALRELNRELDTLRSVLVAEARVIGVSDAEVARRLGISRQAVSKRYPRVSEGTPGEGDVTPRGDVPGSTAVATQRGRRGATSRPIFEVSTPGGRVLLRIHRLAGPGR